jgi:4-hydroxy-2-oxoheptanedioate aldolase
MSSMPAYAALSQKLGGGSGLFTGWVGLPDPLLAGLVAREDLDAVTMDMQHGMVDLAAAVQGIGQILLAGKPALVRIPVGEFQTASRMLDAGASGIIAPMVNSVEDARRLAEFTKFPPVGERSWGPHLALGYSGLVPADYLRQANSLVRAIAMVETRESLAALDDILSVDGIDGVFVGPSDLSIALSDGGLVNADHAEVDKALDHVVARCRVHEKAACTFAMTAERARDMRLKGFDLTALGNDVIQLRTGIRAMLAAAKKDA